MISRRPSTSSTRSRPSRHRSCRLSLQSGSWNVRRMLEQCARGARIEAKKHRNWVYYDSKIFRGLPLVNTARPQGRGAGDPSVVQWYDHGPWNGQGEHWFFWRRHDGRHKLLKTRCAPVAQMDRAAGFEPVGRGFKSLRARQSRTCQRRSRSENRIAPVAQLDRASASGAEGRRFESCRARQPSSTGRAADS